MDLFNIILPALMEFEPKETINTELRFRLMGESQALGFFLFVIVRKIREVLSMKEPN